MKIGDFVKLEADECPEDAGVVVGFVIHYPHLPPHLAFRGETRLLEPDEVPPSLREKATALINGAQGVFEEALTRPATKQIVELQRRIDELERRLEGR